MEVLWVKEEKRERGCVLTPLLDGTLGTFGEPAVWSGQWPVLWCVPRTLRGRPLGGEKRGGEVIPTLRWRLHRSMWCSTAKMGTHEEWVLGWTYAAGWGCGLIDSHPARVVVWGACTVRTRERTGGQGGLCSSLHGGWRCAQPPVARSQKNPPAERSLWVRELLSFQWAWRWPVLLREEHNSSPQGGQVHLVQREERSRVKNHFLFGCFNQSINVCCNERRAMWWRNLNREEPARPLWKFLDCCVVLQGRRKPQPCFFLLWCVKIAPWLEAQLQGLSSLVVCVSVINTRSALELRRSWWMRRGLSGKRFVVLILLALYITIETILTSS